MAVEQRALPEEMEHSLAAGTCCWVGFGAAEPSSCEWKQPSESRLAQCGGDRAGNEELLPVEPS